MPIGIDDCDLDSAKIRQLSEQTSLYEYEQKHDEQFIGTVRKPTDDLLATVKKNDTRLAPPAGLFEEWIRTKNRLQESGRSYGTAHNEAFNRVNYESRYREHLDKNGEAINEYVTQIRGGNKIVLVCYCNPGLHCHRKIAKECIYNRLVDA